MDKYCSPLDNSVNAERFQEKKRKQDGQSKSGKIRDSFGEGYSFILIGNPIHYVS